MCHCFPVGAGGLKDDSDTKLSRVVTCHLKDKKTFANNQDMFQNIALCFVYVFFSMLYLGYLKHALARTYFYPRAVILVKCDVLDYICHPS